MPVNHPPISFPIAQAYGCLDCHRASAAAVHGRCPVCGSLNIQSIGELWDRLKTSVGPFTGKKRLILPLPLRRPALQLPPKKPYGY